MMEAVFIKVLNMSISAGWLILAVMLLRLLLKKAPKWISVVLWGLVGLRLVFPFSLQSVLSLIPSAEVISPSIGYAQHPEINSGVSVIDNAVNPTLGTSLAATPMNSVNPMQIVLYLGGLVWVGGIVILLLYGLISYLRLRRKVTEAIPYEKNTWLCDQVKTPFILGVFRPRIYLPSGLNEKETAYVLAHERAHLKRKDHLWKPLGFLLLTVYWFNPLVWVAYILLCRDIEAACDEKVISDMAMAEKKAYANALVSCSMQRRLILACPLAFGEVGVKERVKGVLNYYYSDASFSFAPDGTLLDFSVYSLVDVVDVRNSGVTLGGDELLKVAKDRLAERGLAFYNSYYPTDLAVSAKVYIDRMTYGLVRIEIENGITYRYLPALCIDGHVELYDEYGKIFYESTTDGLTRMLVLNAVDGTDIVFSSYNSFTHIP